MIIQWIAYAMLCSAALAGVGACADYAIGSRLPARRVLWIVTIAGSAVLPLATSLLVRTPAIESHIEISAGASNPSPTDDSSDRRALWLWACTSALIASWLLVNQIKLPRVIRAGTQRDVDGVSVLLSPRFGPALVGVFRPRIVLPHWVLGLPQGDRRLVIAHEAEHRAAHDPALLCLAVGLAVLFPWNLALWWQITHLRLAIEFDCDARVVRRHDTDPYAYGELLVVAQTHSMRPITAALALLQTRSSLGRRIDALVGQRDRPAMRRLSALATAAVLCSVIAAAPAPSIPRWSPAKPPAPEALLTARMPSPRAAATIDTVGRAQPHLTRTSAANVAKTRVTLKSALPLPLPQVQVTYASDTLATLTLPARSLHLAPMPLAMNRGRLTSVGPSTGGGRIREGASAGGIIMRASGSRAALSAPRDTIVRTP